MSTPTLAEDIAAENDRQRRRFVHATRPREPMTLAEAAALCRRMESRE